MRSCGHDALRAMFQQQQVTVDQLAQWSPDDLTIYFPSIQIEQARAVITAAREASPVSDAHVSVLMDLGASEHVAQEALRQSFGNVAQAANLIIDGQRHKQQPPHDRPNKQQWHGLCANADAMQLGSWSSNATSMPSVWPAQYNPVSSAQSSDWMPSVSPAQCAPRNSAHSSSNTGSHQAGVLTNVQPDHRAAKRSHDSMSVTGGPMNLQHSHGHSSGALGVGLWPATVLPSIACASPNALAVNMDQPLWPAAVHPIDADARPCVVASDLGDFVASSEFSNFGDDSGQDLQREVDEDDELQYLASLEEDTPASIELSPEQRDHFMSRPQEEVEHWLKQVLTNDSMWGGFHCFLNM